MKDFIITVCLIGALLANPISYDSTASETTEEDSDLVGSATSSHTPMFTQNHRTDAASPETSSESSESVESTSEDNTSEESDSESDENSNPMGETRDDSMGSEENVRKNLIEVIPDNLGTEESTEAPTVETPTAETTAATSDSSESTSETSESSESNETRRINIADCVNATESCESDEYFFQGIGDDGLYTVDNLMAPDDGERELQLRR
uniref:Secretory calcium-binding phosphoprotein 1 n=1 Tax=Takifugu rubripes TaxID=31033 RepID=A0A674N1F6_TAKRU